MPAGTVVGIRRWTAKHFYRSEGKRIFGNYSDEELKSRFLQWVRWDGRWMGNW